MADRAFWRADRRLLAVVDGAMAEAASRAGHWLACRPGCTPCCIGPFPISTLDAARLVRGLDRLAAAAPAAASRIRARAVDAVAAMAEGFPGDASRGGLASDEAARDLFFASHETLPCPALDPTTGRCELYDDRPISCRTFGPPVRIGSDALPPCRLCFSGAPEDTVEAGRVTVEDGEEARLLDLLEAQDAPGGETVVAYALAAADTPWRAP